MRTARRSDDVQYRLQDQSVDGNVYGECGYQDCYSASTQLSFSIAHLVSSWARENTQVTTLTVMPPNPSRKDMLMTKSIQTLVFSPQGVAPCWVALREIGSPKAVTDAGGNHKNHLAGRASGVTCLTRRATILLTARTVVSIKTRDDVPQVQPRDPN
jgi:hypothetical protein